MTIYLDNASTTRLKEEVFDSMLPYLKSQFENPSSLYDRGILNKKVINASRKKIANLLNCDKKEIYFTSGGSESNNWALKGLALKHPDKTEIITTTIEHQSVLNTCHYLESKGYTVHYLEVDDKGYIDLNQLKHLINDQTLIVSIMMANNEIGTIQPIKEISNICREHHVYFHTDAVQALCHIPVDIEDLNIDLLSFSAHKFHGPKGIGALFIRKGIEIENLIHGGQQEQGLRAGTESIVNIVGMTKALEIGLANLNNYQHLTKQLSSCLLTQLKQEIKDIRLNGPTLDGRLPGNLNLSFRGIDGSVFTFLLNKEGISVSTGSACDSQIIAPSHVLKAIRVPDDYIQGSIRITINDETTEEEILTTCQIINEIINNNQARLQ